MPKDDNLREAFLLANANLEFISSQFADVIRDLMRAAVANEPSAAVYRAAEKMNFVAELLSRTEDKFGFQDIFENAVSEINFEGEKESSVERAIISAAEDGVRFLVERSCADNAAKGRTSKRRQDFLQSMKWIEAERESIRRPGAKDVL